MNLGAEPKKLAALGILALIGGYSVYTNILAPDVPAGAKQSTATKPAGQPSVVPGLPQPPAAGKKESDDRLAQRRQFTGARSSGGEYRPTLKYNRPEERPDPMKVDPTLRLDLLARLQKVTLEGGHRSLFDFGTAPPPKSETPKIIPGAKPGSPKGPEISSTKPTDAPPASPVKPPPPPIPLKFYGFVASKASSGTRRAFFLEGEDIHVAGEGEMIKRRYKIVKVGPDSAVVEDTEYKNQQTLKLEEPPPISG